MRRRRGGNKNNDIGWFIVYVICENIFMNQYLFIFAAFIFMIDMKSTSSNNNNNKTEAIYGQTSLVDDGAQAASKSVYDRVDLSQAAVYGETSLRTE